MRETTGRRDQERKRKDGGNKLRKVSNEGKKGRKKAEYSGEKSR